MTPTHPLDRLTFFKWTITVRDSQGDEVSVTTFYGTDSQATAEGRRLAGEDCGFSIYSTLKPVRHPQYGDSPDRKKRLTDPKTGKPLPTWVLDFVDESGNIVGSFE
jgi:hypothetical protein